MPGTTSETAICVFARAPVSGAAKTRLIPLLGADGAAALQGQLIAQALATARAAAPDWLALWCTPDAGHPLLQSLARQFDAQLKVQQGADLGERMTHAFAVSLQRAAQVLLIGSDCPALTAGHLQDAAAALRAGSDAVLVPAEDGGYALIGLARNAPRLFADIIWGGPEVMTRTRSRLRECGLRGHELETLWDVDRPQDFLRLRASGLLHELPSPA